MPPSKLVFSLGDPILVVAAVDEFDEQAVESADANDHSMVRFDLAVLRVPDGDARAACRKHSVGHSLAASVSPLCCTDMCRVCFFNVNWPLLDLDGGFPLALS